MNILVDTSVWSLVLRRGETPDLPETTALRQILSGTQDMAVTTGLIFQELLQGFSGPKNRELIIERFQLLPTIQPTITDHIEAAEIRNTCRRSGVQIGTVDAVIAQLCVKYDLVLLSTDKDFQNAAEYIPLKIYKTSD